MKKPIALILALVMALSLFACGTGDTDAEPVTFTVIVTDLEGNETTFHYTSSADTVGEALEAEGLISGEEGEYGLFLRTVNGIVADWDADQTYWAFYIDGEYAMTGVDETDLVADTTYSFVLTKGE